MSTNITSATVLVCRAHLAMADVAELLAVHDGKLPEMCFLHGLAERGPDANGNVALDKDHMEWSGVWSGHSYFDVFLPHVAPKIRGALDVVWTWEDGHSGLRVRDGKVSEPSVVMTLAEDP